jgi:hypothetical protein
LPQRRARHGFDYWQQLADGRIVLGRFRDFSILTEMTDEEITTEPIQEALDAFLVELLGYLPKVTHRWAGIFGLTQDLLPLVGRVARRRGSPRAIRATGTSWASCAASSSRQHCKVVKTRCWTSSHRRDSSCPADHGEPAAALSGTDVAWGLTPASGQSVRLWKRVLPHVCVPSCGQLCGV